MTDSETAQRLVRYEIGGLFGRRDFAFDLEEHEPTILTGANGTGKSTILRSIEAIGSGDWLAILRLPFRDIALTFDEGQPIRISRDEETVKIASRGLPTWTFRPEKYALLKPGGIGLTAVARRRLAAMSATEAFTTRQLEYVLSASSYADLASLQDDRPGWVDQISARLPVLYVTDQRLVVEPPAKGDAVRAPHTVATRAAVDEAADTIRELMSSALSAYAAESQRLDRDFPKRVVTAMSKGVAITDDDLRALLADNDRQAALLQDVGLLPEAVATATFTDFEGESVKPVIATFARDAALKLAVLAPLRERLSLLTDFVRQHYRDKRFTPDPKSGFRIEVDGNQGLRPSQLSSGEQQILVLAYQILFRADPGTLLLIDEPELSLHVVWQDSFINDITRMGAPREQRFLLATHSPTLIGGRDDLRRSLDDA